MKIFKHYKLKPSFSIIKDNKAKDRAGFGGQAPTPKFRQINQSPNLIQFLFFHLIGYLEIKMTTDLNHFHMIWSYLIQFCLFWSNLILFEQIWFCLIWFDPGFWSNSNKFEPLWSNLIQLNQFYLIWTKQSTWSILIFWSNLNQFDPTWSDLIQFVLNYSSKWINGLKRPTNIKSEQIFFKSETNKQQHDKFLEA